MMNGKDVFECHAQAMLTVYRLLTVARLKIKSTAPDFSSFESVETRIYSDFVNQCLRFSKKISEIGHFRHIAKDNRYVYLRENLVKGWAAIDNGSYESMALIPDPLGDKIAGWGCYRDNHRLCFGTFKQDMNSVTYINVNDGSSTAKDRSPGASDVAIAPVGDEPPYKYYLLITVSGRQFKENGRLIIQASVREFYTAQELSWLMLDDYPNGTMYVDETYDLIMARPFKASIREAPTSVPVSTNCVYLLAQGVSGKFELGYAKWNDLKSKPKTVAPKQIFDVRGRFAVSKSLVFFQKLANQPHVITYCLHDDFVDATLKHDKRPEGTLDVRPTGKPETNPVRDMFACSDDHLLVVLDSGEMWNVRLKNDLLGARKLDKDQWAWSKIEGAAFRVAWASTPTNATFEALKEVCKSRQPAAA